MAEFYTELGDDLKQFIGEQKMFFTASAARDGRVNVSPKGMDTLRVIDEKTVIYLDLTGSGNETAAHIGENGRLTIMLCSFDAKAMILRLYGQGRVVRSGSHEWHELFPLFEPIPGARQIVVLTIDTVQTSCGYAVPRYEFKEERQSLRRWAQKKGEEGAREYRRDHNVVSLDGLPTHLLED